MKKFIPGAKVCSREQLEEYLDCSRSYIYDMIKKGLLKPRKIGGRKMFFVIKEVDEAIESIPS